MSNRSKKEDKSNMVISRNKRLDKKLQEEDLLEMEEYPKFYVRWIDEDIGRGVFAKQEFQRGDCLLEYKGIFSTSDEVKDDTYVFEINHKGKSYIVDATSDDGSYGRLINDDDKHPNCRAKVIEVQGMPHIIFVAVKHISANEELRYNYGTGPYPWRNKMKKKDKPSAPIGPLQVSDLTEKSATLSWKPPALDGGTPLTKYIVEMMESTCSMWRPFGEVQAALTQFTTDVLRDGKEYYFCIMAVNAEGQSEPLQTSRSVKTVKKIDPPNTPTFVKCSIVGIDSVELKWDTSMCDDGAQITGYEIYKATSAAPDWKYVTDVKGHDNHYLIKNLTEGQEYYFAVTAKNDVGVSKLCEMDKPIRLQKRQSAPSPPVGPLKVIDIQHDGLTLTWNPSINDVNFPVIAYVIEQRESYRQTWSIIKHTGPNEHKLVLDGLQEGQEYYFRVSAENAIGRSEPLEMDKGLKPQTLFKEVVSASEDEMVDPVIPYLPQLQIITFAKADSTGSSELSHLVDGSKKNTAGHVDRAKKNTAGHVILDKRQYCYICQQPVLKLARHLLTVHKEEPKIIKLTVLKEKKKIGDYLKSLKELRALGNFVHNVKELQKGGSNIVVVKRPNKERPASDFLPCSHCYGFYVIDELWRHSRVCEFNSDSGKMEEAKEEHKYVIVSARILLESASFEKAEVRSIPDDLQAHVLVNAKHDDIYKTIISDSLILTFGAILLKKLGPRKANDISQRMRQLGRLSMTLKSQSSENLPLGRYISGGHFDKVVEAAEELCGLHITSDGRRGFSTPSLAVRLGHLLMKFANVKRGVCLRSQDTGGTEEAEAFISLHKSGWTDTISSNALNSLKRMKDQQISLLPLTQDLTKIRDHHKRVIKMYLDSLSSDQNYSTWRKLSQLIMSRLILFNKRRGGEVSRLLLHTYTQRPVWSESANKEIMSSLQPLERELMKRVDLVQKPGKKNRKVPLLITSDMKQSMDVLVANRKTVGIPEDNPYFFASKSSSGYLDSWQAMNAIVQEAGVQHPELVTSTRIRKYNATVCQLFDLTTGELEWLANHMGHDINIHKDFYRLHDSTVEIAKVSRLLLAIDSGNAAKFQGKRLQDIGIDDFDDEDIDNEDNDLIQEDEEIDSESEEDVNRTLATGGNIQEDNEIESEDELCTTLASGRNIQEDEDTDIEIEEDLNKTLAIEERSTTTQKKWRTERKCPPVIRDNSSDEEKPQWKRISGVDRNNNSGRRARWSSQECQVLKSSFGSLLTKKLYPSGQHVERFLEKHPILHGRTKEQIKAKLQHLMKKCRH